jgi:hypothetical protein
VIVVHGHCAAIDDVLRPLAGRQGAIAGAALAGGMLGGLEMRRRWWVFDGAGLTLQAMA